MTAVQAQVILVQCDAQYIPLKEGSVHCVVTSPPYYGLRSYSGNQLRVWGGDPNCKHEWISSHRRAQTGGKSKKQMSNRGVTGEGWIEENATCEKCGAWYGSLGQEPTPEMYVEHLVGVFREVWRVLRRDGVVWLNLGDSYAGSNKGFMADGTQVGGSKQLTNVGSVTIKSKRMARGSGRWGGGNLPATGYLKPKDLIGIPWQVAIALQKDGWWLRSDVVWQKVNAMCESVGDRPTRAHEYVFMLTKSERYFYDNYAVREPIKQSSIERLGRAISNQHKNIDGAPGQPPHSICQPRPNINHKRVEKQTTPDYFEGGHHLVAQFNPDANTGANLRTIWNIPTHGFHGAHFATFPPRLVERIIRLSTSERGVCPQCGKPWKRVVQKPDMSQRPTRSSDAKMETDAVHISNNWAGVPKSAGQKYQDWRDANPDVTVGWRPTCRHYPRVGEWQRVPPRKRDEKDAEYLTRITPVLALQIELCEFWKPAETEPSVVLDPFIGSGTTCMVANWLRRDSIGLDLSMEYLEMAEERVKTPPPSKKSKRKTAGDGKKPAPAEVQIELPLFTD